MRALRQALHVSGVGGVSDGERDPEHSWDCGCQSAFRHMGGLCKGRALKGEEAKRFGLRACMRMRACLCPCWCARVQVCGGGDYGPLWEGAA